MGGRRQVWINEFLFPSWHSAEQTQSLQEAAPEEYPKGTGNVLVPSRAHSPSLPSVAMAQLWLTPFRDVPRVLVATCGPEITQAELSNHPPVMENTHGNTCRSFPKRSCPLAEDKEHWKTQSRWMLCLESPKLNQGQD